MLNGRLRSGADPHFKTAVVLGVQTNRLINLYVTNYYKCCHILPRVVEGGNLNQSMANNVSASGGKSGGNLNSKTEKFD